MKKSILVIALAFIMLFSAIFGVSNLQIAKEWSLYPITLMPEQKQYLSGKKIMEIRRGFQLRLK